jgi:hypothetical protein
VDGVSEDGPRRLMTSRLFASEESNGQSPPTR